MQFDRTRVWTSAAILGPVFLVTIAFAEPRGSKIRAGVEAANQRFMDAVSRGDAAAAAALYTARAQLLPPNSAMRSGKQAIQAFWQETLDAGVKQAKLQTVEVEGHGDTAYEVGQYWLAAADGRTIDSGKYVVVWKREQGQWRLHRDIWNSNKPVSGQ